MRWSQLDDACVALRSCSSSIPSLRAAFDRVVAEAQSHPKGRVKKLVVPGIDPNLGRSGPETIEDTGHTMPAA
jgi:hypothetical protein